MSSLETENERLQETLYLASKKLTQLHNDNERLEAELRAARLKLEKIWRLAR